MPARAEKKTLAPAEGGEHRLALPGFLACCSWGGAAPGVRGSEQRLTLPEVGTPCLVGASTEMSTRSGANARVTKLRSLLAPPSLPPRPPCLPTLSASLLAGALVGPLPRTIFLAGPGSAGASGAMATIVEGRCGNERKFLILFKVLNKIKNFLSL